MIDTVAVRNRFRSSVSLGAIARPTVVAIVMFMAALLLAYAMVWPEAPYWSKDTAGYVALAEDLRHVTLSQAYERTPGLPILLILTGADRHPTRLFYFVQLELHFSSIGILAYLLGLLGLRAWFFWLFVAVGSSPPLVEWAAQLTTETLSEFFMVATLVCAVSWFRTRRKGWMVALTLAGIGAALTRPTFQLLVPVIVAGVLGCLYFDFRSVSRRELIALALATILSVGTQVGFALVNYVKFGYFGTNTFAAYALSSKVVGVVEFLPDQYQATREILVRHRDKLLVDPQYDHTGENYIFRALPELVDQYGGNKLAALKGIQKLSLYLIVHRPMSYVNECLKAMAWYWMPTDGPLATSTFRGARVVWGGMQLALVAAFFVQALALVGTFVFRVPRWARTRSAAGARIVPAVSPLVCTYIVANLIIWYTMLVSCCFAIGLSRYRIPTELLIMATTLIGFRMWVDAAAGDVPPRVYFDAVRRSTLSVNQCLVDHENRIEI